MKILATNKKASFEYEILDKFEAGLVLVGSEVKSAAMGHISLLDAFARVDGGELWLYSCYIKPYEKGSYFNEEPRRTRKLLMHRSEIGRIASKLREQSLTLIPLRVYFSGNRIKVELALARGKKLFDKRVAEREKVARREASTQSL